jgi:predicted cytidylate kinase
MKKSNHRFKNIALSGDVGTGTTTLGRNLASTLGWQHVNAGDYFRAYHREKGIPLEQTKDIPERVDRELDDRFQRDMLQEENKVFESHLAGWLARESEATFKILCIADDAVTMPRIAAREGWNLAEARKFSQMRSQGLNEKFGRLYGVTDPYDAAFFDVVIDTTHMSAGQVLDFALKSFLDKQPGSQELAHVLEVD